VKALTLTYAVLALASGSAFAADSPWTGTWKLDESKSHLSGDTFTYSKGSGGLIHFSDGSTVAYDFAIDGKEYKAAYNRTTTWTAAGKDAWDQVTRVDGRVIARSHRSLSADAKTLTIRASGTRPDSGKYEEEDVYQRLSGSEGLIGEWRSVKVTGGGAPPTFVISFPAEGVWHFDLPEQKGTLEGRADGTDHPLTGPTTPPGYTSAFKLVTPRRLTYVLKLAGKPDAYGEWSLATDGKSYTEVSWSPGKKNEKTTAVYIKQ
jgi:hypothetical protein